MHDHGPWRSPRIATIHGTSELQRNPLGSDMGEGHPVGHLGEQSLQRRTQKEQSRMSRAEGTVRNQAGSVLEAASRLLFFQYNL